MTDQAEKTAEKEEKPAEEVAPSVDDALEAAWKKHETEEKPAETPEPEPETTETLQRIRQEFLQNLRIATTLNYGPRLLHSSGQLHKGGPNTGLFIQLVDEPTDDLKVPETNYTFGTLIRAQALGDYQTLKKHGRRVLRINLKEDVAGSLSQLSKLIRDNVRI